MAKGGKLTKIKSVLKKMQSFKLARGAGASITAISDEDLRPVYVGKSRRRFLVSSDVLENPLFRELVDRSGGDDAEEEGGDAVISVGCEVVLFEHLLWMLENGDPQAESLDELVDFYTCQ